MVRHLLTVKYWRTRVFVLTLLAESGPSTVRTWLRAAGLGPVRHAITTGMTLGVVPFSASQNWFSFTTSMLSS
jgi:hypothetical protein